MQTGRAPHWLDELQKPLAHPCPPWAGSQLVPSAKGAAQTCVNESQYPCAQVG
jgi:hypothetical protein